MHTVEQLSQSKQKATNHTKPCHANLSHMVPKLISAGK